MLHVPTATLRRLQRVLGLGPLLAFTLYHLWEHWPIRHARGPVLARLDERFAAAPVWLQGALLGGVLLAHALSGALLWRRGPSEAAPASHASYARAQRAAAVVLGVFLLWHVGSLWPPARDGVLSVMAQAEAQLDSVYGSLLYVVGWSGLCAHLGYGLWHTMQPRAPRSALLWALLTGLGLWLIGVNILTAYVAGAPLW